MANHQASNHQTSNHHFNHIHDKSHRSNEHIIHEGNTLIIKDVSRTHSGVFECIANNSVPPAASRKIRVSVECKLIEFLYIIIEKDKIKY